MLVSDAMPSEVWTYAKKMWEAGLVVGSAGNVSRRLDPERIAITPSAVSHPEVGAIVHTHAPYATTLSVLRKPLPPVIDEMVLYLGGTVGVAEYAFTGTEMVGTNVVRALGDHTGVLLANHGNVCVGRDLAQALHVAHVMESCARVYVQALAVGTPVELPNDAIAAGRKMFEARHKP